ncbi:unnamed protein product [Diabrotica balteata]|uniref:HTH psq-type domain-containing protein n=1 Tax=Diabrotica balteata TaxID=107213 RepID=A0A9N9SX29_DIABA|nr:unnamed protein product [Diabrotica balteata]
MSSKSKQKPKKWDSKSMHAAITAVKNKEMAYLQALKTLKVSKSTLEDYVKNKIKSPEELIQTKWDVHQSFSKKLKRIWWTIA